MKEGLLTNPWPQALDYLTSEKSCKGVSFRKLSNSQGTSAVEHSGL